MQSLNLAQIWSSADATGGVQWRDTMRALYSYYRRDMRDAREQRSRLYPKNYASQVLRTVPFVWSLCREMATSYVEAPARRWVRLDAQGNRLGEVDGPTLELIQRIYQGAQVDRRMQVLSEHLVALGQAVCHVWPHEPTRGVRLVILPPHDQDATVSDPFSADERDLSAWQFIMPLQLPDTGSSTTVPQWSRGEITPSTAVWIEHPTKQGQPIFTNYTGRVPVVMLRASDPGPGEWWAPAPEDLLDAQRAIVHDLTDVGHVARLQGYSQPVAIGLTSEQARELEIGPETAIGMRGEGVDFKFVSPQPNLTGYVEQAKAYVDFVVASNGMNPAVYMKSPGITALAKYVETQDRDQARKRQVSELRRAEQRIYDLIRLTINAQRGVDLLPDCAVEVEYHEPQMPADPLHDAQALQLLMQLGQTGPSRARAKQDGIAIDEAKARVEADRAEYDALQPSDPAPAPMDVAPPQTDFKLVGP